MDTQIVLRKINVDDAFRARVQRKLDKIERLFRGSAHAVVTVSAVKGNATVELVIRSGGQLFRAEQSGADKSVALDSAADSLLRQIRKNRTRLAKRLRDTAMPDILADEAVADEAIGEEEDELKIERVKSVPLAPMDPQEAILQMNLIGHQFFMFKDAHTGAPAVVYRRLSGGYGLLEPDHD